MSTFTIVGATGLIGRPIALEALRQGHAGKYDPRSLDASEVFLDHSFTSVIEAMTSRAFVFGESQL